MLFFNTLPYINKNKRMNIKRILLHNKNFKLGYYLKAIWQARHTLVTAEMYKEWNKKLVKEDDLKIVEERVEYYNKLEKITSLSPLAIKIKNYHISKRQKVYFLDTRKYLKFFNSKLKFQIIAGDVTKTLKYPTFVKSRPIAENNNNNILLNLNKVRHFNFIKDEIEYDQKKDLLIGRLAVYQEHRKRFYQLHYENPLCDLGDVARNAEPKWKKEKISITEHLNYKFILALEGNDVATNLKWIMSSNSIAVMPTPKYETWFMEGTLIPDYHYIQIKEDYSNLTDKLEEILNNPEKAKQIIANAHRYIKQFQNQKIENIISVSVMEKYFKLTQ